MKNAKLNLGALSALALLTAFACLFAVKTLSVGIAATALSGKEDVRLNISARASCLMEADTGTVIFAKDEKAHYPIASMVKIMTLNLIFDDIAAGKITPDDLVTVSENAAGMGGSQAFLDAHKQYKIDDLIMSITIASANDSCVAMAEHLEGGVEGFVARMNERARALGMNDTVFANCTGLPSDAEQYSCAYDVALMTRELCRRPDYYKYAGTWMKDMVHDGGRVTGLTNTNKLIRFYNGCDGGKTGFTNEAMHCLSATARRGGMRLISTVVGAPDSKVRFAEVSAQFNYGFSNYAVVKVVTKDAPVEGEFPVSLGRKKTIGARAAADFSVFGPRNEAGKNVSVKPELNELKAPRAKDSPIGKLSIYRDGVQLGTVDILSNDEVQRKTYGDYVGDLIRGVNNPRTGVSR
jgi:D-alanyl-D-alanine carboxypeptidase (penicillin-binding protein 5/6)